MIKSVDYTQWGRNGMERSRFQGARYQLDNLEDMFTVRKELLAILEESHSSLEQRIYDTNAVAFTEIPRAPRAEPFLLDTWKGVTRHAIPSDLEEAMKTLRRGATVARVVPGMGAFLRYNATEAEKQRIHTLTQREIDTVGMDFVFRGETKLGTTVKEFLGSLGIVQKNPKGESPADTYSISAPFNRTREEEGHYRNLLLQPLLN
jgi:hypothetical protein